MSNEAETAVIELHRYLSGLTPPLRASEFFGTLVDLPPERVVGEIQAWVRDQRKANLTTPASEFVFHAVRKLYLIGELGVVDPDRTDAFFDWLLPLVVESSPHDERTHLRARIAAMTHRVAVVPTFSGNIPIPSSPPPPIAPETEPPSASDRFSLILDRLTREQAAGRVFEPEEALAALAQLVMLAATTASTRDELRDMMRRIPPLVDPKQLGNVFQLLGRAIPPWEVVLPAAERAAIIPSAVGAMRRFVSLSADDQERAKRLRELILASIEQFNTGSLFAASMMLELARSVMLEPGLATSVVDRIWDEAARSLDGARLRTYAGERARHVLLRTVLGYFPSLSSDALLGDLRGENRPERRRALLGLLEAWGSAGRDAALRRLKSELEVGPAADTWFLRNTIFLLHRIPRESDSMMDEELEILREASSRDQVIYVVKEAVTAIGAIGSPQATRLLLDRLIELENGLRRGDESQGSVVETLKTVDRVIASLARIATPDALRRVVTHGLRADPALGDTRGRMVALAQVDLSPVPDAVAQIISTIRTELPGMLGRVIGKAANTMPLLQALSSTDTPAVRALLEEISSRHQRLDLGPVAQSALAQLGAGAVQSDAAAKPASRESGELRPFGLPELVQTLAESKATGILAIASLDRQIRGRLVFSAGRILSAETSKLRDDEAFFNLIEHPEAGWFTFAPQEVTDGDLRAEITPLLVEGLRRHDELLRTRVLVPDNATYKHRGPRPTPHSEEKDPVLMKEVWRRTISGRPLRSWADDLPADAFRVRQLVVHWLEEGAIEESSARS